MHPGTQAHRLAHGPLGLFTGDFLDVTCPIAVHQILPKAPADRTMNRAPVAIEPLFCPMVTSAMCHSMVSRGSFPNPCTRGSATYDGADEVNVWYNAEAGRSL